MSQAVAAELHFVRVKRGKDTYFVQVKAAETGEELKVKIQAITELPTDHQRFYLGKIILEDRKKLVDQKVENESVIQLRAKNEDNGEWEPLEEVKPEVEEDALTPDVSPTPGP